jgi:tRNA/rRNA methyltransferase
MLDTITLVLYEPQQSENVGAVLRVMKNFGLHHLRLVRPAALDPARLEVVAHRSTDLAAAIEQYPDLDTALADATFIVGATARSRALSRPVQTPREAAPTLLTHATTGRVALLFGREDHGLPNTALDRCHALLTIPTSPAYPSLNLAQAVLITAYELHLAAANPAARPTAARPAPPDADLERFFTTLEQALTAIHFLKPGQAPARMRRLRALLLRAAPDQHELALLHAIFHQLLAFLRRL